MDLVELRWCESSASRLELRWREGAAGSDVESDGLNWTDEDEWFCGGDEAR